MSGVVSRGRNNDELVDNLCKGGYIVTPEVERVFRILDRRNYMLFEEEAEERLVAYGDHAWQNGNLHLSAPYIYTKAMELMNIQKGQSFLNLGSGTGYLSTMAGLLLGATGINHGIEIYQDNIEFANEALNKFKDESPWYDPVEFCEPSFNVGNGLLLSSNGILYDKIYCGAECPPEHVQLLKNILKVNGILILPCESTFQSVSRISEFEWDHSVILPQVAFASLILPSAESPENMAAIIMVSDVSSLKDLCRLAILSSMTRSNYHLISTLPLPTHLHQYLSYNKIWEPNLTSLKQLCSMAKEDKQSITKGGLMESLSSEGDNIEEDDNGILAAAGDMDNGLPIGGLALLQRRDVLQVNTINREVPVDSDQSSLDDPVEDNVSEEEEYNSDVCTSENEMEEQEQESENEDSDDD